MSNMKDKKRLFVDMDGTLAEWKVIDIEDCETAVAAQKKINSILLAPGYFLSLAPHENVVKAISKIITNGEIEVFVLSCVLPEKHPRQDKETWLDKYLPKLDAAHRIFVPYGAEKSDYVPGGQRTGDYLLDDYTQNLKKWVSANFGTGIKLLNAINSSKNTWGGCRISYAKSPSHIADAIRQIVFQGRIIRDEKPKTYTATTDLTSKDDTWEMEIK